MKSLGIFTSLLILFLLGIAHAAPYLYNPVPKNNSYVPGGPRTFYINITESNLNASSVTLYIKAVDEPSWEKFTMQCENLTASDWICNTTAPFGIVGSDTLELYYFNASDNLGNYSTNGTAINPLRVTIDKNPPYIAYVNPQNQSWVRGIVKIELTVTDVSSGVNASTVNYSLDNSTWKNTINNTNFHADWDTSSSTNNQTVTIYSKASDNVGNTRYAWINVTVDNEIPRIIVINPSEGQRVSGITRLKINVTDLYSGIDTSNVFFSVDSTKRNMDCYENVCDEYFDTRLLTDGNHMIRFNVSDKAGNSNSTSVNVLVDNTFPSVKIENPKNNAFISEKTFVNATVTNPSVIVQYLQLLLEKPGYPSSWINMTDAGNYKYYYPLDSDQLAEGSYKLTVRAVNTLNYFINDSISLTIDRTKPVLTITSPELYVKGIFYPQLLATDEYRLNTTVTFSILSHSNSMNCQEQLGGKRIVCGGNFDSSLLKDSNYTLTFYVQDLAGNRNSASKEIKVDNNPPVLRYLKIEPITAEKATTFKFYLDLADEGSYVKTAKLTINYPNNQTEPVQLSLSSIWTGEKFISTNGIHIIDLEARDLNDNILSLSAAGFFYIGSINCGNLVCESNENYCICSVDCPKIDCKPNEVIDCGSGMPKCIDATLLGTILQAIDVATMNATNITTEGNVTTQVSFIDKITEIFSNLVQIFSNLKISIPLGLMIALIVLIILIYKRKRKKPKKEKPWYETIGREGEQW